MWDFGLPSHSKDRTLPTHVGHYLYHTKHTALDFLHNSVYFQLQTQTKHQTTHSLASSDASRHLSLSNNMDIDHDKKPKSKVS